MKAFMTTLVLILGLLNFAHAQETTKLSKKQKVWIKEPGSSQIITSYLLEVKDSSLVIIRKPANGELQNLIDNHEEIYYNQIEWIKIRKSNLLKNAGYGLFGSAIVWFVIEDAITQQFTTDSGLGFKGSMWLLGALAAIITPICTFGMPTHYRCKVNGDYIKFRDNKHKFREEL